MVNSVEIPMFPYDKTCLLYTDIHIKVCYSLRILLTFVQDMCYDCHLAGSGGICEVEVPLNRWGDRMWFRMALSVIGLHDRFIRRILPGVHNGEQNFSDRYTGKMFL